MQVHIRTHDGDDVVDAGTAVTKVIWEFGGLGADDLTGGARDDYLDGGEGNDALKGRVGNDILEGRAGNDSLVGDAGDDILRGAEGDDFLDGQEDNDLLDGGDGADEFSAATEMTRSLAVRATTTLKATSRPTISTPEQVTTRSTAAAVPMRFMAATATM